MSHVNHITWEWAGTCDDSGLPDMNGDSDALPRAWWAIGPNGDKGWSVSLVWFIDDTDDQDEEFLTNLPDQRQARMFCMDFQRDYGYRGLTPGQAIDAWCDDVEVAEEVELGRLGGQEPTPENILGRLRTRPAEDFENEIPQEHWRVASLVSTGSDQTAGSDGHFMFHRAHPSSRASIAEHGLSIDYDQGEGMSPVGVYMTPRDIDSGHSDVWKVDIRGLKLLPDTMEQMEEFSPEGGSYYSPESIHPSRVSLHRPATKAYGWFKEYLEQHPEHPMAKEFGQPKTAANDPDYRMQHTAPGPDTAPLHDLTVVYPEDVYTHPHYYGYTEGSDWRSWATARSLRGKPEARVRTTAPS